MPPLAAALGALVLSLPGGAVDGARVLGATVPAVEAALGTPSSVETLPNRRDLTYRGRLEVIFAGASSDPAAQTAWALLVLDPRATVPGLGRPLALAPRALESRLRALGLRETRAYRCDRRGCFGTFTGAGGTRLVIYGLLHGRRYLGVQVVPKPEP
ncbi:MAG: hypothetical protein JOZ56_01570 [Actinobacteria bacterium]|nr:hypothetical protein [Actinomycetota bacterium]MBV8561758.1 hypothetical protein [Actinomycetota bacterium]